MSLAICAATPVRHDLRLAAIREHLLRRERRFAQLPLEMAEDFL